MLRELGKQKMNNGNSFEHGKNLDNYRNKILFFTFGLSVDNSVMFFFLGLEAWPFWPFITPQSEQVVGLFCL